MFKKFVVLCIAIFLVFNSMASFAEEKSLNREISEKLIVQIDFSSWIQKTFRVSPDSKHVAYMAKAGNKMFVVVDGKEEKQYDAIIDKRGRWFKYNLTLKKGGSRIRAYAETSET